MWKVAGRVTAVRSCSSLTSPRSAFCGCNQYTCSVRAQHTASNNQQKQQSQPQQPPLSQPLDKNHNEFKLPPPPPPGGSNAGKYISLAAGGMVVGTGILLATDENSRIAAVEKVPALQPVFDFCGLSTVRKQLPSAPKPRQVSDNYNVMSIAEKSVSQITHKSTASPPVRSSVNPSDVSSSAAIVKTAQPTKPEPASPPVLSKSDSALVRDEREHNALVTNIADDSVRLLLSGKRTPDELDHLERRRLEAESQRLSAERERSVLHDRKLQEKKDADALAAITKKNKELAEEEKARDYERIVRAKNREVEEWLARDISCVLECAEKAVTSNKLALDACKQHSNELKKAMEADKDSVAQEYWSRLCEYRELRQERVSDAQRATEAAQTKVQALLKTISEAKSDELTRSNPALNSYQSQAKKIANDLDQSKATLDNAETMEQVMKYYFQLLQRDRTKFEQDLHENLPDVKAGLKGNRMTQEELSALLAHAHQRIFQLKRKLRENEAFEQQRLEDVLTEQKQQMEKEYKDELSKQLSDMRCKCATEKDAELLANAIEQERKIREELARQALAHNNHLTDMLKLQQSQLVKEFNNQLSERIDFERSTYVDSLAKHIAKIEGLMSVIEERADVDKSLNDVRKLMSSSQALMYTLAKEESEHKSDAGYEVIPIDESIQHCEVAGKDSSFVKVVLESIPERARQVGVYTQSALEQRFEKVMAECKKMALYPTANNIISQSLSNIYSKLALYSVKPKYTSVLDFENCQGSGMDTRDLLIQAQYFMDKKCLAAAVKCMVQLDGVPRNLAQEWIEEARLVLEIRQAAEALYTYAMSKSMGVII